MMNKEQKRQTWAKDSWFGMPCSRETKHCRFWSSRLLAQYIILVILSHPTCTLNILALMSVQIQKAQEPLPLYSSLCLKKPESLPKSVVGEIGPAAKVLLHYQLYHAAKAYFQQTSNLSGVSQLHN